MILIMMKIANINDINSNINVIIMKMTNNINIVIIVK